jgi:hypothetical protein
VRASPTGLVAEEQFATPTALGEVGEAAKHLVGPPAVLILERLADTPGAARDRIDTSSPPHPILEIETSLDLEPGEARDLWFRFGRQDNTEVGQPDLLFKSSLEALAKRLPTAAAAIAPEAALEIPWHGMAPCLPAALPSIMSSGDTRSTRRQPIPAPGAPLTLGSTLNISRSGSPDRSLENPSPIRFRARTTLKKTPVC